VRHARAGEFPNEKQEIPMQATQVKDAEMGREFKVVGLVSFAHLLSHLYMLALAPLFPFVRDDLGVTYVELGLTITAYAITTGLLQTPMGFLVNRIGGGKVLVGGLFLNALAIALVGLVSEYWQLIALMFLAGVGSSVFHPADYSILAARVKDQRLGRALAVHALGGNLGFLVAPPLMVGLTLLFDWRTAMMIAGGGGVLLALAMMVLPDILSDRHPAGKSSSDSWGTLIRSPTLLLLFLFYTLSAGANSGIVHFSVAAFRDIYGLPVAVTAMALTAYQALAMLAVLPGGWLADRVKNHELVLAVSFAASGALVILGGIGFLPFFMAIGLIGLAGGLQGLVNASRDVSVRKAATHVSVGTVFGFVTTGYSAGQIIGPALYGWLMDLGRPELVFWVSAAFSTLAIATMLGTRSTRTQPAAA